MEPYNVKLLVEVLLDIGDLALQKRAWITGADQLPMPEELLCMAFDDTGVGDSLQFAGPVFSAEIDRRLRSLSARGAVLGLWGRPLQEVLDDPVWQQFSIDSREVALSIQAMFPGLDSSG